MSTSQTILENAAYHATLLKTLDELSYAPSALSQQTTYLADLEARVKEIKANVEKLASVTKKERKDHEKLRDSTARKLAAKMTGKKEKFEARREKEEREYVEALENEMKERGNLKTVETMIVEGNRVKDELSEKSLRLSQIENEIQALYDRIFGGPTQEFPRDDQLESQLSQAQGAYDQIQDHLNRQSRAVNLLREADNAMRQCLASMQEALSYSTWDTFGGGTPSPSRFGANERATAIGRMSDMMERSALGTASVAASRAHMLVQQAQRTSSDVRDVGPIRVYEISLFGDVFFDNIFSDIAAHNKMQANQNELFQAHERLRRELRAATARCERIGPDLIEAAEVLSQCRHDLAQFRKQTFERVSAGGDAAGEGEGAPPPLYEADGRPPSFPQPEMAGTPGSEEGRYPAPTGPPPGHHDEDANLSQRQNQPPAGPSPGHEDAKYQPPHGPPPGHEDANTLIANSSQTHYQPPPDPPPGHTATQQGEGESSSVVPKHWGTKNPFAMSLMGESGHRRNPSYGGSAVEKGREISEEKEVPKE
ncbi:hypothetical protein V5O48_005294 [Marasmius crinis-equi]|uniref:Uncharacterized protein n=1 Tax=Marasmius crinis-equi TaxID=585013 RepID=A0ABR3FNF7_9AGAR